MSSFKDWCVRLLCLDSSLCQGHVQKIFYKITILWTCVCWSKYSQCPCHMQTRNRGDWQNLKIPPKYTKVTIFNGTLNPSYFKVKSYCISAHTLLLCCSSGSIMPHSTVSGKSHPCFSCIFLCSIHSILIKQIHANIAILFTKVFFCLIYKKKMCER